MHITDSDKLKYRINIVTASHCWCHSKMKGICRKGNYQSEKRWRKLSVYFSRGIKRVWFKRYIDSSIQYLLKVPGWAPSVAKAMVVASKVYKMLKDDKVSLQDSINCHKHSGQWGLTLSMDFTSLVLNVNIFSLWNLLKKFETFSTVKFLGN